jgi:sugar lactone lactonase YvrE
VNEEERRILTTHIEPNDDGTLTEIEVDAEGNMTANQYMGSIVVVDPDGRLAHLRHLDTTGYYDQEADGADER